MAYKRSPSSRTTSINQKMVMKLNQLNEKKLKKFQQTNLDTNLDRMALEGHHSLKKTNSYTTKSK